MATTTRKQARLDRASTAELARERAAFRRQAEERLAAYDRLGLWDREEVRAGGSARVEDLDLLR